ncbi:hypothetical protein [Neptuniibacter sp. QD37_11]|uniref:hypothetical protein n=1 Tax=Neptuniibacter sp. QD37_11 TaxID=3398209 RepID=UPI0039F5BBDE
MIVVEMPIKLYLRFPAFINPEALSQAGVFTLFKEDDRPVYTITTHQKDPYYCALETFLQRTHNRGTYSDDGLKHLRSINTRALARCFDEIIITLSENAYLEKCEQDGHSNTQVCICGKIGIYAEAPLDFDLIKQFFEFAFSVPFEYEFGANDEHRDKEAFSLMQNAFRAMTITENAVDAGLKESIVGCLDNLKQFRIETTPSEITVRK